MSDAFPLQPLLELANDRMDEAARQLGRLIASEREGAQKLKLLQDYRAEYVARFTEATRNGIGPEAWRNYRAFIAKLDEAIAAQQGIVDQSKRRTAAGQQAWVEQRNKVKAFDTLQHRHQAAVAHKAAKLEQRQSDEHAAKQFRVAGDSEG